MNVQWLVMTAETLFLLVAVFETFYSRQAKVSCAKSTNNNTDLLLIQQLENKKVKLRWRRDNYSIRRRRIVSGVVQTSDLERGEIAAIGANFVQNRCERGRARFLIGDDVIVLVVVARGIPGRGGGEGIVRVSGGSGRAGRRASVRSVSTSKMGSRRVGSREICGREGVRIARGVLLAIAGFRRYQIGRVGRCAPGALRRSWKAARQAIVVVHIVTAPSR